MAVFRALWTLIYGSLLGGTATPCWEGDPDTGCIPGDWIGMP